MSSALNNEVCQTAISDLLGPSTSLESADGSINLEFSPSYYVELRKANQSRPFPLWQVVKPIALLIIMVSCIAWGYYFGRLSVQSANDLISAGFIVADPDGYEVEHFDDGLAAVVESFTADEENPFN